MVVLLLPLLAKASIRKIGTVVKVKVNNKTVDTKIPQVVVMPYEINSQEAIDNIKQLKFCGVPVAKVEKSKKAVEKEGLAATKSQKNKVSSMPKSYKVKEYYTVTTFPGW